MKKITAYLSLVILFCQSAFGTEESDLEKKYRSQRLVQRQYWLGCLEPLNPEYNADPIKRPYKLPELMQGFNNYLTNQIPFLPGFHIYYQSDDSRVWIARRTNTGVTGPQIRIKLFDAEQGRTNLIVHGDNFNFSFAYTQRTSKEKRKHPPMNLGISQPVYQSLEQPQEGHGGDQADSRDGMGYDRLNFMPQFIFWNEKIRNPLVGHQIRPFDGSYGEYSIAGYNPPLTIDGTFIPEGYLFLKYVNKTLVCYLFPNYPSWLYHAVEKYLPKGRESRYLKFMDIYKVDLADHVNSSPFIHTRNVSEDDIEQRVEQNFRTADAIADGRLQLITRERLAYYPSEVVLAFYYRMAMYLYEQGASIEMFSISNKLSLVERLVDEVSTIPRGINFYQPDLAKYWLSVSEDQVRNVSGSILDKLQLYSFHTSAHHLIEGNAIRTLQSQTSAEELYDRIYDQAQDELVLEEDVDEFMETVDKIPENSAIYLGSLFLHTLNTILFQIYDDNGFGDIYDMCGSEEAFEYIEEDFDEEDKDLINSLREAKNQVVESIHSDKHLTNEELGEALKRLGFLSQAA